MTKDFSSITEQLREASARSGSTADRHHLLTIGEQLEAIQRGDLEAALRQAHEDIEFEIFAPPRFHFITRARGIDELRRAMKHNFHALADQKPTITNVITQGDVLVLIGSETGTVRETGEAYHVQTVHRFTFNDRSLAHIQIIAADVA